MSTPEHRLISGDVRLQTSRGPIEFAFQVDVREGFGLVAEYLGSLLPESSLITDASKPAVLRRKPRSHSSATLQVYAERRTRDPIFALIPEEELGAGTPPAINATRVAAVNVLKRAGIVTVDRLAILTDEEISRINGIGIRSMAFVQQLRNSAQQQLEKTRATNGN